VVLSKEGCHLCDRVIETLRGLSSGNKFDLEILDITTNDALFKEYFLKIPVVRLDGEEVLGAEQIARPEDCKRNLRNLVSSLR
jgi:glutaredoxin